MEGLEKIQYIPLPVIQERLTDKDLFKKAKTFGLSNILSKVIANRKLPEGTDLEHFLNPSIANIPISKLQDIVKAGDRIAEAVINKEVIALVCDFDVDGISSAAVMYKTLVDIFNVHPTLVKVIISNRMKESYGFSQKVLDRIIEHNPIPTLLITADQGSADCDRVTAYMEHMKKKKLSGDVIITDHHEIPTKGGPKQAFAFVNPQRKDDLFPDKTICGCTVALFTMASTRASLIKKGYLESNEENSIKHLMAYSTAATIADCVSMASYSNRAIVIAGLAEINACKIPAWKQMRETFIKDPNRMINAEDLGFGLGPRINACSRTGGDGLNAVKFYLAETDEEADRFLSYLTVDNNIRKDIEKKLVEDATKKAQELVKRGYVSLVIFNKDGHHGIHGIAASRIVERFGRPVIMLSPKETQKIEITREEAIGYLAPHGISVSEKPKPFYDIPKSACFISSEAVKTKGIKVYKFYYETILTVSGSARSIDGLGEDQKGLLSILECLVEVQEKHNIFLGFGGHCMAAGMALPAEHIKTLRTALEEAVRSRVELKHVYPKIWTDGQLPDYLKLDLELYDTLKTLEPYGRQFDYPSFTVNAKVIDHKIVGANEDTGSFDIFCNNQKYTRAMWFKYGINPMKQYIKNGQEYKMVVQVKENWYNGKRYPQIQILHAEPL